MAIPDVVQQDIAIIPEEFTYSLLAFFVFFWFLIRLIIMDEPSGSVLM